MDQKLERKKNLRKKKRKLREKKVDFPGRKRPAIVVRKQRSKSLSIDNKDNSNSLSTPAKSKVMYHSAERLPNLTPFDEERIVWMKNLEDDIANEDARRIRCLSRQQMLENDPSSSSSPDSGHGNSAKGIHNEDNVSNKKSTRKHWDRENIANEYKLNEDEDHEERKMESEKDDDDNKKVKVKKHNRSHSKRKGDQSSPAGTVQQPLNAECFIVSRGWQMDQVS